MQLPPLQPIRNGHFCVSGDVSIAPSAVIAPGVLLQADPDSRLVIAAEVSIGAGSVVHAHGGMLEIASGATLGAGVLVIGGSIGTNACIGARATLWSVEIAPNQVVAANALIGDLGRQVELEVGTATVSPATAPDPIIADPPRGAAVAIYGKAGLNRLMGSLFPYRQMLGESQNGSQPDRAIDSDSTQ